MFHVVLFKYLFEQGLLHAKNFIMIAIVALQHEPFTIVGRKDCHITQWCTRFLTCLSLSLLRLQRHICIRLFLFSSLKINTAWLFTNFYAMNRKLTHIGQVQNRYLYLIGGSLESP